MAGSIKGITIEFRGDTTRLDQALRQINNETKAIDKELRNVDKALKFNPTSVELWRQKQELLKQKISETKDKLELLKQEQAHMDAAGVDKNSEEYRKLQREIIETESKLKTFEGQLKKIGNVNLRAMSEQFKEIGTKLESAGRAMQGLSTAAAAVAASIGALTVKSGKWADDMNTMSKVYSLSTGELQKYSAAADLVDVSVDDIAKSHLKLEKQMLSASKGTGASAEAFEKLGIEVTNADGSLRDGDAVWQDTIKALGSMKNETERDALAMTLMGKSAANLNPLIEDGGKTYKEVAETLAKYDLEFIDQETLDNANAFNDSIDMIKTVGLVAFQQLGTQLAAYLAPAMEKVVDLVGQLAGWFANLSPQTQAIIAGIAAVVAVLSPLLIGLGKVSFAISSILSLAATLGPIIGGLSLPILGIVAVVAAAVAAGVLLYKNWDTIKAKALELKAKLIETWNNIKTSVLNTVEALKKGLTDKWNAIKEKAVSIWNAIKSAATTAWNAVKTAITTPVDALKTALTEKWNSIKTTATTAWNDLKSAASTAWNAIKKAMTDPIEKARDTLKGIVDKIKGFFPISIGNVVDNLKLPHFTISGKFSINPPSVPKFSVSWYKQGGIFDNPTIAGIGEAGPEAVVPLDKFWDAIENSNRQTEALLVRQNAILLSVLDELSKEKNFKVDGMWAGRYVNSLVKG